tara:strand:+ start:14647 stop:15267 length:621 start_codon:yes stop_codon:yes gene_type:complete
MSVSSKIKYFILFEIILTFFSSATISDVAKKKNVALRTSQGDIFIELYSDKAPITANNFLRHLDEGFYDGSSFYRTVTIKNDNGTPKIEVIQGGIGDRIKPFSAIKHESTDITGLSHIDGTISMSRYEVDTATSDFFICIGDQKGLDFGGTRNKDGLGFSAFGRVISGMDIVRKINLLPSEKKTENIYVQGQMLDNPVVIYKAERL